MNKLLSKSSLSIVIILTTLFFGLSLMSATNTAFPYINLDEQGHISYALHLVQIKGWFPDLTQMRLYNFAQMQWSAEPNFINHPPFAYHLLNLFSQIESPQPEIRFTSVSFFSLGFLAIVFGLHKTGTFSNLGLVAVTAFCVLLKIHLFSAAFTNDAIAFLGGSMVFVGTIMLWNKPLIASTTHVSFIIGGIGLALCFAAKLNAAVLVGIYLLLSLVQFIWRENNAFRQLSPPLIASLVFLCSLAALPYIIFLYKFGTPAPNTTGQIKILVDNFDGNRLDFGTYLFESLKGALGNAGPDAFITYSIFAAITAITAFKLIVRTATNCEANQLQNIAIATVIATAFTFVVHIAFSYQRHLEYGWQPELYPRYYFPLLGPYLLLFFSTVVKLGPLRAFAQKVHSPTDQI